MKLDENEANLPQHVLGPMTAVHLSATEAAKLEFESYVSFGMPLAIVNLERDVDDVAGTERWIREG